MSPRATDVVLVTGGTGLIGAAAVRALGRRGLRVVALDHRPRHERLPEDLSVTVLEADLTDSRALRAAVGDHGVTHVLHLAAMLSLDAARQPARAVEVNSVATLALFELALEHRLNRVVWASTTGMYGRPTAYGDGQVDEDTPPVPRNLYAATKLLNEVAAEGFRDRGLDVVGLRPVLTYGDDDTPTAAGLVNQALRSMALGARARIGDPWARRTRINVMHADDCADLFVELLLTDRELERGVYNAGTGEYAELGELFDAAVGAGKVDFESEGSQGPSSAGVPLYDFPDVSSARVRTELDWRPRHDFASGAREVMELVRRRG